MYEYYVTEYNYLTRTAINTFLGLSVYYFFFIFSSNWNGLKYYTPLFQPGIVFMKWLFKSIRVMRLTNSNHFQKKIFTFT